MVTDTIRARLNVRACWHCGSTNTVDWHDNEGIHIAGCKDCGQESGFDEWNVRAIEYGQSNLIELLGDALYTLLLAEHDGDADWVCGNSAYQAYTQWKKFRWTK